MAEDSEANEDAPYTVTRGIEFYQDLQHVADYYSAPNGVLQTLANSANNGGSGEGIPITLFTSGGMISGHITSLQKFHHAMGDWFRTGIANVLDGGEVPDWVNTFAENTFDSQARFQDELNAEADRLFDEHGTRNAERNLTRHIYLTNVKYTVPGVNSIEISHIAVQLSHVAGWTLGAISWGVQPSDTA